MQQQPILEMRKVSKSFPGVAALRKVDFRLFPGEIHGLMGQNGAGKSTLIKVLTGVEQASSGHILLGGERIAPRSPQDAQSIGISTVYQEVNLCANLSVAENLFIGNLPRRGPFVDRRLLKSRAEAALAQLDVRIDVMQLLGDYPVAIQQMVAIARALSISQTRILVLDEPTSSLDEHEVERLFAAMRRLKARGVSILFVTHFLDQTYALSDRISVMRNGELVGEFLPSELPRLALISKMIGRDFSPEADCKAIDCVEADAPPAKLCMRARGLGAAGVMRPFDLDMRPGEVLALGGLLGSGRSETAKLLFGLEQADAGSMEINGQAVHLRSPRDAVQHRLAYCPEERKTEGIVADLSVRENIVLALQARRGILRFVPRRQQLAIADEYIKLLGIKTPDADKPIGQLSGGNQQKALLARWLVTDPQMLILDEPTRGIDVAAKQEIMDQILTLCAKGMAILFISSEMEEVMRVSHRIAVLRDRKKVAELRTADVSEHDVFRAIAGGQA